MDLVRVVRVLACHCGSVNTGCDWFYKFGRFTSCCCHGEGATSRALIKQACCHKVVYTTSWCVSVCVSTTAADTSHLRFLSSLASCHRCYFSCRAWPLRHYILLPWPMTLLSTLPFCVPVKMHPLCRALCRVDATAVVLLSTQPTSPPASCLCSSEARGRLKVTPLNRCLAPDCVCASLLCTSVPTLPCSRRPGNRALTCEPGLSGLTWLCAALFARPGWVTCSQCDTFPPRCSRIEHTLTGCDQHSHPHRACHRHRSPLSRLLLLQCCCRCCGLDGFVVDSAAH